MADNLLDTFRQQETEQLLQMQQYNQWSQLMIELLIQEQEERLLASDLSVDADSTLF